MSKYYLPYNFVPVTGKVNGEAVQRKDWHASKSPRQSEAVQHCRNDIYQKDRLTGTIKCKIIIKTPTMVGASYKKIDDKHQSLINYSWRGLAAIPGNSLRGLIASTAETISQSSLRVLDEKTWGYFADIDGESLTPFNDSRNSLTPAELIFGTVSLAQEKSKDTSTHRALSSRVRFTDGISDTPIEKAISPEITMLALASPRLHNGKEEDNARPKKHDEDVYSTYFSQKTYSYEDDIDAYSTGIYKSIVRKDIESGDTHNQNYQPNGRKQYLFQGISLADLHEKVKKQRRTNSHVVSITPLKVNTEFNFTVSFSNLTDSELGLLVTALRPSRNYNHRIGMGKNLGLGAILINLEDIAIIDSQTRYDTLTALENKKFGEINTKLVDQNSLNQLVTIGTNYRAPIRWRNGYPKLSDGVTLEEPALPLPGVKDGFVPYLHSEYHFENNLHSDYLVEKEEESEKTYSNELFSEDEFFEFIEAIIGEEVKKAQGVNKSQGKHLFQAMPKLKAHADYAVLIASLKNEAAKKSSVIFSSKVFNALKNKDAFMRLSGLNEESVGQLGIFDE